MSCTDAADWVDETGPVPEHGGDGTAENPYYGALSGSAITFLDNGGGITPGSSFSKVFIEVGTVLDLEGGSEADSTGYVIDDGERYGIGISTSGIDRDITIHGTVSTVGVTLWGTSLYSELDYELGVIYFVPEDYTPTEGTAGIYHHYDNQRFMDDQIADEDDVFDLLLLHSDGFYRSNTELNILQGSYVDIYTGSDATVDLGDHTSLSIDADGRITGYLNGRDVLVLQVTDGYGNVELLTITPVSESPELEFMSDPADGLLIPPNHHLVTFIYLDGTTVYRVVEHGGFLDDVPTISNAGVMWYAVGMGQPDLLIPITSDFVFEEIAHSGGGSVIG